jgi:6-phosphogluconolactonase
MKTYQCGVLAASALACIVAAVSPLRAQQKSTSAATGKSRLYIAALTSNDGGGICQAELDSSTGELRLIGLAGEAKNPLFLALHPNHQYLFATCEIDAYSASQGGAVAAFKIDPDTGELALLNHRSSEGAVPCHLSLDRNGKHLLVANYRGGNAAIFTIGDDGHLGQASAVVQHHGSSIHKVRQAAPHPHSINLDPANRFVLVADAGNDRIFAYRFDMASGTLTANAPPSWKSKPGAAPRHLTFHPNGKWAYAINELDSTMTLLSYDADLGVFDPIHTVTTLPSGTIVENLTAEVAAHPSGKFLYGSNRGHDSIAMFAIDQTNGRLTSLGHHPAGGRTPRNFVIDPSGKVLITALQDSNRIVVHKIDPKKGTLAVTKSEITIPQPVCIKILPL